MYVLIGHNVTPVISYRPVFAAKDLDVNDLVGAQSFYSNIEPCVAVDGAGVSSDKCVIG